MRPLILLLVLAFIPLAHAAEDVAISIELKDTGAAHVIIESHLQGGEDVKGLLREPAIKEIYRERLFSVFGEINDLDLRVVADSLVIEFDSSLAVKNDVWTTIAANFSGVLTTPLTLTVKLPENMELVSAVPPPVEISDVTLTWNTVDSLPLVTYKESSFFSLWFVLLLAGLVLSLVLLSRKLGKH